MLASASAFDAYVGIAVDPGMLLHGVAFLSWNQHPEPKGSRRATPLLPFQYSSEQPPEESPLEPLIAVAEAERYRLPSAEGRAPFHGYFYKILTRQGRSAPGGAQDYLVKGHLTSSIGRFSCADRWLTRPISGRTVRDRMDRSHHRRHAPAMEAA